MSDIWIGIDIAKEGFVAWMAGRTRPIGSFANCPAGFEELCRHLDGLVSIRVVVEPTGGYEGRLVRFGLDKGWGVCLVNPARVRDWARGEGRRAKTDRQDAKMLADYGADKHPAPFTPLPAEVSELESLIRRKTELEEMLGAERNRAEALTWKPEAAREVPASVDRLSRAIADELARVEGAIKALLSRHADLAAKARLLETVPGIGAKTALPVLVFLERFGALTRGQGDAKAVAAYAGLDPKPYESGKSVRGPATISRMGDRQIRRQMVMAALGGVRGKSALGAFYSRLVGRGKPKLLSLVAAARKIITWAWAVYRRGQPFCQDHLKKVQPVNP